jgi:hypothetical protein
MQVTTSQPRAPAGALHTVILHVDLDDHLWVGGFLVAASSIFTSVALHFFLYVQLTHHLNFSVVFLESFEILPIASFSRGFYGLQPPLQLLKH